MTDSRSLSLHSSPRGFLAPAMYLMGRFTFPIKALIISLVFLAPMSYLMFSLYDAENTQIEFAAMERHGVRVMAKFNPFMHALLDVRNATRAGLGGSLDTAADYASARQRVEASISGLDAAVRQDGDPLGLTSDVEKIKQAFAGTLASKNGVDDKGRTVFGPVTSAAVELLQKMGDRSNLVLDPDLDTFYLMNALVLSMPKALEDFGQIWGWSAYALQKGALTSDEEKRYFVWDAVATTGLKATKENFQRAIGYNASLSSRVKLEGIDRALAFRERVKSIDALVASDGNKPEVIYGEGKQAMKDAIGLYDSGLQALDELLVQRQQKLYRVVWWSLASVSVAILVALYLFFAFYRVMHQGLATVGAHLAEMAEGDLRHKPAASWAKDEPAVLLAQLATTYEALHGLIRKVRHGARELHTASDEISAASADLAARTEASAAALEQQASAMEEIGAIVGNTAHTAQDAAAFSERNAEVANRAGETIQQVVATMQDIHSSSAKINDIIGVIDGIAFQTNILALNAAVEAARAGEAGRGFAVVASEVRSLAQRSAGAAKEIKALISASVEKTDGGKRVVQAAGTIMEDVVTNARQVNHLLADIATSSREQASGVEQVGHSIQELDRSTQQNAALVEQTTAAAVALKAQADRLQDEIKSFRVA